MVYVICFVQGICEVRVMGSDYRTHILTFSNDKMASIWGDFPLIALSHYSPTFCGIFGDQFSESPHKKIYLSWGKDLACC